MREFILIYAGFGREPGWCHVVVSTAPGFRAALLGELQDNPGTSVTNALEEAANGVASTTFEGRHDFSIYQYDPAGIPTLKPTFWEITWKGAAGTFALPLWEPVDPAHDQWLTKAQKYVMPENYTAVSLRESRALRLVDSRTLKDPVSGLDTIDKKVAGPLMVERDTTVRGMITNTATVTSGARLELYGMVAGDLVVEPGGTAKIYGMITGDLTSRGRVELYGTVTGAFRDMSGDSYIDPRSRVGG